MGYWTTGTLLRGIAYDLKTVKAALFVLCAKRKKDKKLIQEQLTIENVCSTEGEELLSFIQGQTNEAKEMGIYVDYFKGVNSEGYPDDEEAVRIYFCDYIVQGLRDGEEVTRSPPHEENPAFESLSTKLGLPIETAKLRMFHYYG